MLYPIAYRPSTCLFKNDREAHCFQHFCKRTASNLSGPFDSNLWSRLVPQVCESSPGARHAVVAIAALTFVSESEFSPSASPEQKEAGKQTRTRHRFALQQYSEALRQMRNAASETSGDVRTTLITCVLIVCFETLYGNHQLALAQARTALRLASDCFDKSNKPVADAASALSPVCCGFEEELVQAFVRLEIHVATYMKSRPTEGGITMSNLGSARLQAMPRSFASIKEARMYLEASQQRLLHLSEFEIHPRSLQEYVSTETSIQASPSAFPEEVEFLAQLAKWHIAFSPILQRVRLSKDHEGFRGAMTLQLHYLTTYITVVSTSATATTSMCTFMPLFEEMISLSESILEHPDCVRESFTFDSQVVKPLWTVARKCPHRLVRRQAISLLLSSPRREGFWDAILSGKLAAWIATVEEEEVEGDYVPEEMRISNFDTKVDLQARTAQARCLKPYRWFPGKLVPRSVVLSW